MGLVLLGSVAMPSLARKKKVQPVQKPAVQEDTSLSERPPTLQLFLPGGQRASRLPAIIRQLSTCLSMPVRSTRRRLRPISMSRFSILN